MQNNQVFVLPSQEDIATFLSGAKPANVLVRTFDSADAVNAYRSAHGAYLDIHEALQQVCVNGLVVTHWIAEGDDIPFPRDTTFETKEAAMAFAQGLKDFEGFAAPMVVTSEQPEDFGRLVHYWIGEQLKVPTIVVYKTESQITRVVSSQEVRMLVLDSDGVDLEEEAGRVINVGGQELMVTDLKVAGAVGGSPYGEQGVDPEFVKGVVAVVQGLPEPSRAEFNKPGVYAEAFPVVKSVPVKHWDSYGDAGAPKTHQIDLDDQRVSNGQVYLTVGALEGDLDDLISVTAEVNTSPLNPETQVACMHVHFDSDNLAFTLFKVNDQIILRPEKGVTLEPVGIMNDKSLERMYSIQ